MKFIVQNQLAFAYTGSKPIDPARPSIVFIHGAANDHSVWQLQSRYFAHHGYNALAVDLPGHGRSSGAIKPSIGDYADWLPGLLDAAGITSATLVGHSMGSLIAIETAMRYPARVAGLALLGISIPMPVADVLLHAARDDPATAFDMLNLWGHGPAAKMGKSPSPGLSLLGNYLRLLEDSPPGALYNDLKACNDYHPDAVALKQIVCPALLMVAARDQMTPAKAANATAALLKNARMVSIEGAGHAMMTEAPDPVLGHLKTFLTT
jgi:pimeloyl-ACP methyl ester carboxylesterase